MGPTMGIQDLDEKIAARKALIAPDGAITKKMKNVEALVAGCTRPFYCGDIATLADIPLFCWLGLIRSGYVTFDLQWHLSLPGPTLPISGYTD